jgi:leucyl-tRNA synthetase
MDKLKENTVEIALQINGKVRDSLKINADQTKEDVINMAKKALNQRLEGFTIVKEIYVPGKIVNIVVKQ